MTGSFLRREWGAVTFVLTVLIGLIVVPLALYFENQAPSAPLAAITPSASATAAATVSTTTRATSSASAKPASPSPTR
jgi:uncharacterized membrane protein YjjP (DUF1212 family)